MKICFGPQGFKGPKESVVSLSLYNVEFRRIHVEVFFRLIRRMYDLISEVLPLGMEPLDFDVAAYIRIARGFKM